MEDLQQYFGLECAHLDFLIPMIPMISETDDFQGTFRVVLGLMLSKREIGTDVWQRKLPN